MCLGHPVVGNINNLHHHLHMEKITKYVADDGTEFDEESHCIEYENTMRDIDRIVDVIYSRDMNADDLRSELYKLIVNGNIKITLDHAR